MGEWLRSLVLGIIQGLTEFLPVSSSGHLEIAKYLLGDLSLAEESLMMTVTLHVATALSTIFVFRKDIASILRGAFSTTWNDEKAFCIKVILSMIPAAIIGFLLESWISELFHRQLLLVGLMLIVTGGLLFLADKAKSTGKTVGYGHSIIIGLSQAMALLPGLSRSGATISTSVLLGIDRYKAARFSFLMVVPLIMGKVAYDLLKGEYSQVGANGVELLIGFAAAFFTGLFACKLMIRIVQKSKLKYFSFYCFAIALLAIALYIFSS